MAGLSACPAATAVRFVLSGLLLPLRASLLGGPGQSRTSAPPSESECDQALFRVATPLRGEQGRTCKRMIVGGRQRSVCYIRGKGVARYYCCPSSPVV